MILRSFDANNNPTCETEPHDPSSEWSPDCETSPNPTLFSYDARDNLLSQTDPEGNTTSFTYNARDQVETTTDPRERNNTTTNVYDPGTGNLTKTIDAAGTETDFTYDAQGNVKTRTVTVGGVVHLTSFDYDTSGNLTKETDPEGNETDFHVRHEREPLDGDADANASGQLHPDADDDVRVRQAGPSRADDGCGRHVHENGVRRDRQAERDLRQAGPEDDVRIYDDMGQLATITYPDTTTEEFTYDDEGRRLTSKDRAGRTTSFEYDELGRLVKTTFPDTNFTRNIYDDAGRLDQTIDARGQDHALRVRPGGPPHGGDRPGAQPDGVHLRREREPANDQRPEAQRDDVRVRRAQPENEDDLSGHDVHPDTATTRLGRRITERDQAGVITGFEYDKDLLGRLTKVMSGRRTD